LLRYYRHQRGLSQLDLALAADVSARHVSFLETGRAQPTREMVLRLGATLVVPLREQNAMLLAAGLGPEFGEPRLSEEMPAPIERALERMLAQHEPFPMVAVDRCYDVVRWNEGARRLLSRIVVDPRALPDRPNLVRAVFDRRLLRPAVVDWDGTARTLLSRLNRESLVRPGDSELSALYLALLEYPDVPQDVRRPALSAPIDATFVLRLRLDEHVLAFFTAVTTFSAPQNVTLDELRIESYFPLDAETAAMCRRL
jgi:transcriptional regulator with XRE-family HTH domain